MKQMMKLLELEAETVSLIHRYFAELRDLELLLDQGKMEYLGLVDDYKKKLQQLRLNLTQVRAAIMLFQNDRQIGTDIEVILEQMQNSCKSTEGQ